MNKKDGVVYTPAEIVKEMLSKIKIGKEILEPSCGEGAFLNEIDCDSNIDGFDIDKEALLKIKNKKVNIYCEDFLTHIFSKKYDTIIGNPPYIKIQDLDSKYREFLQKNFYSCSSGNIDIFYAFIEKCISLLKENGEMILIVPNSWILNKSAKNLREILSKYEVEITDFGSEKKFKDADIYTCFLYLKKKSGNILLKRNKKQEVIEKTSEPWVFKTDAQIKIDLSIIKNGIATLCDKIFIFDKYEIKENTYKVLCSYNKKEYEIEKGIVRRCAKISKEKNNICIYPYKNDGTKLTEEELKNNFPLAYNYLLDVKEKLLERDFDDKWYNYGRSQGISTMYGNKILISNCVFDKVKIFFSDDKELVAYSGLYINVENNSKEEIQEIFDYFNSEKILSYIKENGKSMGGNYKTFSKTLLKLIN